MTISPPDAQGHAHATRNAPGPLGEPKKASGVLLDAAINIFLPSFVLIQLSGPERLGEVNAFALAVAIPFVYGIFSALRERKLNWIAALGLANILAAGTLRFLEIGKMGFALKEMLMPAVLGIAVLFSLRTETPFVHRVLYTDKLLNVGSIEARLAENGRGAELDALLTRTTLILAASFFLSAALNFGLAWVVLQSPVGTVEFNQEFGKMTALSWPVIVLPSMAIMAFALWHMASGLRRLTGLALEDVLKVDEKPATAGKGTPPTVS